LSETRVASKGRLPKALLFGSGRYEIRLSDLTEESDCVVGHAETEEGAQAVVRILNARVVASIGQRGPLYFVGHKDDYGYPRSLGARAEAALVSETADARGNFEKASVHDI
jgi:hypothetical protein